MADEAEDKQVQKAEDIKFFHSFIKGQGSLYVLGNCNKEKKEGQIVNNGPKYMERLWNPRPLKLDAINKLIAATADGDLISPHFQQHALIVGVTKGLVDSTALAQYQSNQFPRIVLANDTNGELLIINGHHRIAAYKKVHAMLLEQHTKYEQTLGTFKVASDFDNSEIIEARERKTQIELKLWEVGCWGVVVIDKGGSLCNI